MRVRKFVNSVFASNTYVVCEGSEAVVIDTGDLDPVAAYIDAAGLHVAAILLTHTHYDHIYGLRRYMDRWPEVSVYTSEFGLKALANPRWNFSRYHDDPVIIESPRIKVLSDNDAIDIQDTLRFRVMATPGHDESCLSYISGDRLFCGDSYIPGVKVFATFPHSDRNKAAIWRERLHALSTASSPAQTPDMPDTCGDVSFRRAYPGHGIVVAASNYDIDSETIQSK